MGKKADVGWPYVVAIVISVILLLVLVMIAGKSNTKIAFMIDAIKNFLT